jgi:CysZ protein
MLFQHRLKRYVIIPAIINLILFSIFILSGMSLIHHLSIFLPHYLHWLETIFKILFFLASSVALAYFFTLLSNLIGAPFNSLLSSKVEQLTGGQKPDENNAWHETLKDIPRLLKREMDKVLYYLPRAVILLILFFIPVVNVIAGVLWFVFNGWMMGIQYLDYPMDNHKLTFAQTKQYLKQHTWVSFSFGLSVMVLAMIPIVNLLVMPAAVIGATKLYVKK